MGDRFAVVIRLRANDHIAGTNRTVSIDLQTAGTVLPTAVVLFDLADTTMTHRDTEGIDDIDVVTAGILHIDRTVETADDVVVPVMQNGKNPHDNLSYVKSAQIIISHVKNGLQLAEKYQLPDIIRQSIATHHGTSKAKYFYVKYKNENPLLEIDEGFFTYPGPNPSTIEQAILMMSDSVEAASRSLPEYTEESIGTLVDRIVDSQISEGYFTHCPITFQDIATAKQVLKQKLMTIYHTRISYPELNKD